DKESYWISQELLHLPYEWIGGGGGAVGYLLGTSVCGALHHSDERSQPLWWNGGLLVNKRTPEGQGFLNFTHWATDRTFEGIKWDWERHDRPFCLAPRDPDADIGVLSDGDRALVGGYVREWRDR
ncbi:hypothetical protein BDK51DRAFT_32268, partial [Blyttiomyces helicus]